MEDTMGGNIFKDKATTISKDRVRPTIEAYKKALGQIFPMKAHSLTFFEPVGSAGKKETSGDLDLAIDWTHIVRSFTGSELEKWGINYDDWMVGDIDWLTWSYYSHGEHGLKGLHRTQFLVALFSEIGYTFNHFSGIKEKNTSEWTITSPEDALQLLSEHYGMVKHSQTQTFAQLHSWLLQTNSGLYFKVISRYREILRNQKQEIPNVLTHTI
jgi:hypothetical protein